MINVTSFLIGGAFGILLTLAVLFAGYVWKNFTNTWGDEDSWTGNKETKN